MLGFAANIILPLLALLAGLFLILRLRLFAAGGVAGRYLFLFGFILVFFAAAWQWVRLVPDYTYWFVEEAYPAIDFAQVILLAIGAFLAVSGIALYADHWQTKKEDIEIREGKLSILDNLQQDARQSYPLMELVSIGLKEILYSMPECAGAVFLINRKRRQFVLTTSAGLNKNEVAHLEYYPLDRNIVNQSIELGDPMIASEFAFIDRQGQSVRSRFNSVLVLPLISGLEKIGGILLFSEEEKFFGRSDIRFLSPVAEWMAEKIKSARLTRELSLSRAEVEKHTAFRSELTNRLLAVSDAFAARDAISGFCRALVGVAGSESIHLYGLKYGSLHIYGGSEPLYDLSEKYRTALIDALDREKPLIVNQEGTDDQGRPGIILSSLIVPFERKDGREAILLRRESSAFRVDDNDLQAIEVFTGLAMLLMGRSDTDRLAITRRIGFEKVLEFLQFDQEHEIDDDPSGFLDHLAEILPRSALAVTLVPDDQGVFTAVSGEHVDRKTLEDFHVQPGEGGIGEITVSRQVRFILGRNNVVRHFESYDAENKNAFAALFGENGNPTFVAYCPISKLDTLLGVACIMLYNVDEADRGEWERLLTLATGLYSLRLTINDLRGRQETVTGKTEQLGPAVNRLNNFLSGIIGTAELALRDENLSGDLRGKLTSILSEAEKAGDFIRGSLGKSSGTDSPEPVAELSREGVDTVIEDILHRGHISGDLYMAGGRPRTIDISLGTIDPVAVADDEIRALFESVIDRFSVMAGEDDMITVATYQRDDFAYLDICRHRRNFPPVRPVTTFGQYETVAAAMASRPADVYLKHISETPSFYAVDRSSHTPAFLSFKFPLVKDQVKTPEGESGQRVRVLAIDDEAIILDLVSAMCQSMGYEVATARSGDEGLRLAAASKFDVILTDLAMPGLSGLAVAREIRKTYPSVPIILVTGWERTLDPAQITSAGITEVLYKPFRIEQLTEVVKSAALARK